MKEAWNIVESDGHNREGTESHRLGKNAVLSYIQRALATNCALQCKWKDAGELVERSITLCPTNATAYYIMGVIEREQKHIDLAASSASRAIVLDPDFKEAYLLLSSCQLELGD